MNSSEKVAFRDLPAGLLLVHNTWCIPEEYPYYHSGFYTYLDDGHGRVAACEIFDRDTMRDDPIGSQSSYILYVLTKNVRIPVLWNFGKSKRECCVAQFIDAFYPELVPGEDVYPREVYYDKGVTQSMKVISLPPFVACAGAKNQSHHSDKISRFASNNIRFLNADVMNIWEGADQSGQIEVFIRKEYAEKVLKVFPVVKKV